MLSILLGNLSRWRWNKKNWQNSKL